MVGADGSGTLPVGALLPINRNPSAAYADGRYEQAGIEGSPPSSDARHFFYFIDPNLSVANRGTASRVNQVRLAEFFDQPTINLTVRAGISHSS